MPMIWYVCYSMKIFVLTRSLCWAIAMQGASRWPDECLCAATASAPDDPNCLQLAPVNSKGPRRDQYLYYTQKIGLTYIYQICYIGLDSERSWRSKPICEMKISSLLWFFEIYGKMCVKCCIQWNIIHELYCPCYWSLLELNSYCQPIDPFLPIALGCPYAQPSWIWARDQ